MGKRTFTIEVELPFKEPFSYQLVDIKAAITLKIVNAALEIADGNRSAAARILKIDRANLLRILRYLK